MKKILTLFQAFLCAFLAFFYSSCELASETEGFALYEQHCANCHMSDGQGLNQLIPPLAKSDYLQNMDAQELACIIRYGMEGEIEVNGTVYEEQPMPGNQVLSDVQITNIINYVRRSWGNNLPSVTLHEVEDKLSVCKEEKGY